MENNKHILMCCSDLSYKGGMVTVVKNYLSYDNWSEFEIHYTPTHADGNKLFKIVYYVKALKSIIRLNKSWHIDIAYLHVAERGSVFRKIIIAKLLSKRDVKIVYHHHGAEFESFFDSQPGFLQRFISNALNKADLNIVLSERLVSMIKNRASSANVKVLYNAVETYNTNFYNADGDLILFLGQLGQRKGVYDLLQAVKKIDPVIDKKYKFLLCGDGEIDKVKKTVAELGLEHRIAKVGWIDREEKEKLYNNICLNVLPSYNEGLPMTILETMAFGIPSISTGIASIPEVIENGYNGELIEPGDVEALSDRLVTMLTDRERRVFESQNAWEKITNEFSLKTSIDKLKDYLRELF